jgi:copper resistance protein C
VLRFVRTLALTVAAVVAAAGPAFAHAHLKSSVPAEKAVVAAPAELDLAFTEGLDLAFSGIRLIGPDRRDVKTGDAMPMDGGKALMVPVSGPLAPGDYTVEWHVLSVDGHKTNGAYGFTVKP